MNMLWFARTRRVGLPDADVLPHPRKSTRVLGVSIEYAVTLWAEPKGQVKYAGKE